MEKAAKHYKLSRILLAAAVVTPVVLRLTRSNTNDSPAVAGSLVGSSLGIVGIAFGFSGDINMRKGSSILRRVRLQ